MFDKAIRALLTLLMTVIALSVLAGLAAVLAFALVLALVAVITAYCLAPDEAKRFWSNLRAQLDGWIARLEKLVAEVREIATRFCAQKTSEEAPDAEAQTTAPAMPKRENADAEDAGHASPSGNTSSN